MVVAVSTCSFFAVFTLKSVAALTTVVVVQVVSVSTSHMRSTENSIVAHVFGVVPPVTNLLDRTEMRTRERKE